MIRDAAHARRVLYAARAVLADLDGCLTLGNSLAPGASRFIEFAGERLRVVSNNSTDDEAGLAARLQAFGLAIAPDRIVLAGMIALDTICARWPGARVLILGAEPLVRRASALGLIPIDESPHLVLLARDTGLSFERLDAAIRAATQGCPVVVTNLDTTHPRGDRQPTLETGALAAALRAAAPVAQYLVIGKPQPALFRAALLQAGVKPEEAVMIGDNPATDIAGAEGARIPAILIGRAPWALACDLDELMDRTATAPVHVSMG